MLTLLKNSVMGFHGGYIAEMVALAILVYFVMKTLKENNAKQIIAIYSLCILGGGAVMLYSNSVGNALFSGAFFVMYVLVLSAVCLLLFATEIKRAIWTGKHNSLISVDASKTAVGARAEEYIKGIVKAVQSLSKNNTGALIVLSNGNLPKEIIDSGVTLSANISSQLIEGIFVNKAPLHDGAMVIYGDKIQAAGCFLPLTQKDFPKDYGTRHRAGIGVTEVADVSAIIVSEETGIVSVVKRGEISRYANSDVLMKFLRDYYWKEFNAEGRK